MSLDEFQDSSPNGKKFQAIRNEFFRTLLFLAALTLGGFYLFGPKAPKKIHLTCDAEKIEMMAGEAFFYTDYALLGGAHQSDEEAKSGNNSLKLSAVNPFGFQLEIDDLQGNEYLEIQVWKKKSRSGFKDGLLVAEVQGIFWESVESSKEDAHAQDMDWKKLEMTLSLDCRSEHKTLKVYCWNPTEFPVYFDDLDVKVVGK